MGSAEEFYERVERDSKELVTWKGELVRDRFIFLLFPNIYSDLIQSREKDSPKADSSD